MTIPAAPDDPEIAIGGDDDDTSPSAPLLPPPVTASVMPDRPSLSNIPVATASIATPTTSVEAARVPSFVTIPLANGTGNIERTTNPNDGSLSVKVTTITSQPNGYREILIEYFHIPTDMTSTVSMLIDEGTPPLSVYRTNMERQILPPSSAEVVTSPPQPAYAISPTTTNNNNTINDAGFPQRQPSTSELTANEKTARIMCLVIAVVIFVAIIVFAVTQSNSNYDNNWPTPSPVPAPPPYPVSACNGKRTGGTPGWKDATGDSCEWYERSSEYWDRCSEGYAGDMGPAKDHCCYCLVTAAPSPRPTYYWQKPSSLKPFTCTGSTPNWKDSADDGCDWYEVNDSPGCPQFGDLSGPSGTAKDNCCFCDVQSTTKPISSSSSSPYPVSSCNGEKTGGTPEWKDSVDDGCDWYERHSQYCSDGFNNGNAMGSPMDHCCACMTTASASPSASPVQSIPTVAPTVKPNQESILLE